MVAAAAAAAASSRPILRRHSNSWSEKTPAEPLDIPKSGSRTPREDEEYNEMANYATYHGCMSILKKFAADCNVKELPKGKQTALVKFC